jgi:hypothetical protein
VSSVWYVGSSDERIITSAEWTAAGFSGSPATSAWNESNGWSIASTSFSSDQLGLLAELGDFRVNAPDGPRTGDWVTPSGDPIDARLITTGLLSPARLGVDPDSTKVLYGDGTWRVPGVGDGGGLPDVRDVTAISSFYGTHFFPYLPAVRLVDQSNSAVDIAVDYPDSSHVAITFPSPFTGKIILS